MGGNTASEPKKINIQPPRGPHGKAGTTAPETVSEARPSLRSQSRSRDDRLRSGLHRTEELVTQCPAGSPNGPVFPAAPPWTSHRGLQSQFYFRITVKDRITERQLNHTS